MKKKLKTLAYAGFAFALAASPVPSLTSNIFPVEMPAVSVKAATVKNVKSYDELVAAVKKSCTINITANIKVTDTIDIADGVDIVITSSSSDYIIYPSKEMNKLFNVKGSLQLGTSAADKNVRLRGGSADEKRIKGATIYVNGGKFISYTGLIYKSDGRALNVSNGGTAVIDGTSIINLNTGLNSDRTNGGAVSVGSNSVLKIKGGSIKNNDYGGIYCGPGSDVVMTGGSITQNCIGAGLPEDNKDGHGYGGGVYCSGSFEMSGGIIKGNSAQRKGDGVYITDKGKFYIKKEAMITDNDVALAASAKLLVSDVLTGSSPAVVITPDSYEVDKVIASSSIAAMNASEFIDKIAVSNTSWKLKASEKNVKLTKEYNVSYDANGGDSSSLPEATKAYYNDPFTVTSVTPARTGYTFKGWNTAADGSGASVSSSSTIYITSSTVLYAQWEENNVTVTYNANGGSGAPAGETQKYTHGVMISSAIPVREGYTFKGWNTAADGSGITYVAGMTTQTDLTLYAQWEENIISITYNLNGGNDGPNNQSGAQLKGLTVSSTVPTKKGYTFLGWNTAADGSGLTYPAGSTVKEDIVLYAQWKEIGKVNISVTCSNPNIKLNSNSTNSYGIKCKKKLTFKVNATFTGNDNNDGVSVFYQIVKKGYDYDMASWKSANDGKIVIKKSMKNCRLYIKCVCGSSASIVKTYGFTLDVDAPTVKGVTNGKTYKSSRTIKVSDSISGVKSIKLDGKSIKSGKKVSKKGSHKLVVSDKFGNSKTVKFKIK